MNTEDTLFLLRELYSVASYSLFPKRIHDSTIKSRDDGPSLFLSNFYDFYVSNFGSFRNRCTTKPLTDGTVTYVVPSHYTAKFTKTGNGKFYAQTILNLGQVEFSDNGTDLHKGPNILIIGAGPIGLYLAGMLKSALPHIAVNVVEKRCNDDKKRTLTRISAIDTKKTYFYYDKFSVLQKMALLFDSVCPNLKTTLFLDDEFSLLNHIFKGVNLPYISINYLEYLLANFAQKCGVIIYHDNKCTNIDYIETNYTNAKTKFVFDATGGRLLPRAKNVALNSSGIRFIGSDKQLNSGNKQVNSSFPVEFTFSESFNEIRQRQSEQGIQAGSEFLVQEGFLTPYEAVFQRNQYIYCAIGDTFMKTYFNESNSIAFGSCLSLGLVFTLLRFFSVEQHGGNKITVRKTRKRTSYQCKKLP